MLEFGCGLGRVTRHLDAAFKQVYAVDIAPRMVEAIEALDLSRTTAVLNDGTALDDIPLVDVVYSDSVLLHNLKPDVRRFWPKVCARLKPGGIAAFQLPCYAVAREPAHWTDVGVWTEPLLRALANSSGCRVEKIWANPGEFSFDAIGPDHHRLHLFIRDP